VLFGAYISTVFIWIAEMCNIAILFHISRVLGRDFVEQRMGKRLASLDEKIEQSGFWGIFALRIVPLVPFRFLDLAAGLTKISFRKYFLVSAIGSPLRIFWIQFILAGISDSMLRNASFSEMIPALVTYISRNTLVFFWSLAYGIAALIILIRLKKISKA